MAEQADWVDTPGSDQSRREAQIVDRHLPDGYSAEPEAVVYDAPANDDSASVLSKSPEPESSLRLQGGDMHRDIFKIKARAKNEGSIRRSNTFAARESPRIFPSAEVPVSDQLQPGGMRRQYVQRHRVQRRLSTVATPVTRNFVSFLELYGSFAGEDLEDTDSDLDTEDTESAIDDGEDDDERARERRPLLGRRKSSKRIKREGEAGTTKAFFTLLKAFVGTGIMFLPKAFRNGGILFSSITLIMVSVITTLCFRLLLQCRDRYGGGGYGELGDAIFGRRFRGLILASITLSQLGFVCAGLIFTAENLLAFLHAVVPVDRPQPFDTSALIAIQFVILIPMALIRNIAKLGPAALLADVFILVGLVYIWAYDIKDLAVNGMAPTVKLFNPSSYTLTVGSAIFTFEGIGLILPIQSSMKNPDKFPYLLYLVMFIITCIFTSVGALCYATFGEETKIQIISNYPQNSKLVNTVQFLYSMAVLVGEPVQLFPAVRIIEQWLFGDKASGKKSQGVKWWKNLLRTSMMLFCGLVAIFGAGDLDKFVSLIGAFACVPLVYIYPPLLHLRGMAEKRSEKIYDIALIALGVFAFTFTTAMTVKQCDWCGPCKVISPVFEQLAAAETKPGRIIFAKVNVDNQRDVAAIYGISAMPTFLVLKGSKVVETVRGANPTALRSAILSAAADAAKGPAKASQLFSGKGQTLGSAGSSSSSAAPSAGANLTANLPSIGQAFSAPGAFAQGRGFPAMIVRFLGLYFSTLFSFDPARTAEDSPFAVKKGSVRAR
ncbi:hypothetical protein CERZMDRAFT_116671 [Cercospora zeae-maydis SCOH1-5]|uniref:Thioredoxin domain-containing protein n=1 Tax=Cercospora zeae-maydis SCOH1-5 TaxID=717836 RepID=A0A6A6FNR4_9PEZI|nr:hypothetical protein CERZMDRAFT_116671 [Cercospora zeae-maydis SCOH1-5]